MIKIVQSYANKAVVEEMISLQHDCKIPSSLISKCPVCGGEKEVNIRCDQYFVEDEHWHSSQENYLSFLTEHQNDQIVFLELGVGMNTPSIIKIPFMRMTNSFPNAHMVSVNQEFFGVPEEIVGKSVSVFIIGDIGRVLDELG